MCSHNMAVVPIRRQHTHSSNGVLFMTNSDAVWISCLKESCTVALNNEWNIYRLRVRYVRTYYMYLRSYKMRVARGFVLILALFYLILFLDLH
jgi:hypothetical protein